MASEQPIGPRNLDLGGLTDEQFEQLCTRLIRLEFPEVRSTDNPDGGADALLPNPDGGWSRAWQAKRYTQHIHWAKCMDSLDRASSNYEIGHLTFCFARNLTVSQHMKFQQVLTGRHAGVVVDFWDLDELLARLDGSEEGRRVGRHYFGNPAHDKQAMIRAFQAGGQLDTSNDVLERARPLAKFTSEHDPFFAYPIHQFELGATMPLAPGAIMAVSQTEDGISVRVDAVPRDEDALAQHGPRLRMEFDSDELGAAAAEAIDAAMREHREVTIDAGVQVIPEQLPPLFKDLIGRPTRGTITLTPKWLAPRNEVFRVATDTGTESLPVLLAPIDPPPGWQWSLRGTHGGVTVTLTARWVDGRGGEISINWTHRVNEAPAGEQADALRFVAALHGEGELLLGGEHVFELHRRKFDLGPLLTLLEDIAVIEGWTARQIPLPESVSAQQAGWIAAIANAIRTKKLPAQWESAQLEANQDGLLQLTSSAAIRIEQDVWITILGSDLPLGRGVVDLPEVVIRDLGPIHTGSTLHQVDIRPVGGAPVAIALDLMQRV